MESQKSTDSRLRGNDDPKQSFTHHQPAGGLSNIVQFLETLGAAPKQLSAANYAHAVEALGLDDAARDALLTRDANELFLSLID